MTLPQGFPDSNSQLSDAAKRAVRLPERIEVREYNGFWVVVKDGESLRAFPSFLEAQEMAEAAWHCVQWARVRDGRYIVVDRIPLRPSRDTRTSLSKD